MVHQRALLGWMGPGFRLLGDGCPIHGGLSLISRSGTEWTIPAKATYDASHAFL